MTQAVALKSALEVEYDTQKCWGVVASVNVYGCHSEYIKTPEKIKQYVTELCEKIGMIKHGPTLVERFAEGALEGYSGFQFIETSSITLHFDETENRAFIDIFSCKYFDPELAKKFSLEFFEGTSASVVHLLRS
ncbi:MAG: S-adenosylmethionine decarboxylase [Patescibacteria group bacterium]